MTAHMHFSLHSLWVLVEYSVSHQRLPEGSVSKDEFAEFVCTVCLRELNVIHCENNYDNYSTSCPFNCLSYMCIMLMCVYLYFASFMYII